MSDTMPDGSYPITTQHQADSAWKLRGRSKHYSEAQVVAHIRAMCAKHGLQMPHDKADKQAAAADFQQLLSYALGLFSSIDEIVDAAQEQLADALGVPNPDADDADDRQAAAVQVPPHGFVWPDGMPNCSLCEREPNDPVHVTPPRTPTRYGEVWQTSADKNSGAKMPVRSHSYTPSAPMITSSVRCTRCGNDLSNGIHVVGMPSGMVPASSNSGIYGGGMPLGGNGSPFSGGSGLGGVGTTAAAAVDSLLERPRVQAALRSFLDEAKPQPLPVQQAFVAEVGQRLVFAAPGTVGFDPSTMPRQLAAAYEKAAKANPYNMWLTGRYVEADRPNRNMAFWSTEDLEIGQPTVAHGPLNWNHSEREIIGAIVASELVLQPRELAAATGVGNHIVALAAMWPYIYPERARAIQKASEDGRLWYSMECISEQVQCLAGGCGHTMGYGDFMRQRSSQCQHMREGAPRRFINPIFGGGAVIVPPIRPGWANADARVLKQAAALAERQAAAFTGLSTSDAELLVAQLLLQNGEPA